MHTDDIPLHLPDYYTFIDATASLALPMSASQLHGMMCGYLCAGATRDGESYLRALITAQSEPNKRAATLALFGVYAVSHQQIVNFNFEFQLLLPNDDEEPLVDRAVAFSEWCEGFTDGLAAVGIGYEQMQDDEAKEAMEHFLEFSQLDCGELNMDDEDERALMEVSEYARMAVLNIYNDLQSSKSGADASITAH